MYIVQLKFSDNKSSASRHMDAHKSWIKKGFDDSVFLLAGSIKPGKGGCIIAHNTSTSDLERRVQNDPFVAENIVTAEIIEIAPARAADSLSFLLD